MAAGRGWYVVQGYQHLRWCLQGWGWVYMLTCADPTSNPPVAPPNQPVSTDQPTIQPTWSTNNHLTGCQLTNQQSNQLFVLRTRAQRGGVGVGQAQARRLRAQHGR